MRRWVPPLVLMVFAAAVPASGQPRVPRFEPGPCAVAPGEWARNVRVECGALVVAMDREQPERRELRLAVAILRPSQPPPASAPPLVMLHGGPAGPGGLRADAMTLAIRWSSSLNRDIVVYDQRGAGFSEPRLCPEAAADALRVRVEPSAAERERGWLEAAGRCIDDLKRDGLDPHFFNSRTNVADLVDLRTVLRYESWDLFGVSYGARLAQEAMRWDPTGVHAAVLASPLIPGAAKAEDALSIQGAVERILAACTAQPACRRAFPSPQRDLDDLYAELTAKPLNVVTERDGPPVTVVLDGDRLVSDIVGRFSVAQIDRLPLLLHELRRGDRDAAARLLVGNGLGARVPNNALTNLVTCYDIAGSADLGPTVERVKGLLKQPFHALANDQAMCTRVLQRFAGPMEHQFVRTDIPTLVLTNEFDDRTPTEHARRIMPWLRHGYLFELPGLGHALTPAGCFDTVVESFLKKPTQEPDAACIKTMPPIAFETRRLERPMLFFSIDAGAGTARGLAGRWDAAFPNAPRPFTFSLTIARGVVTGSITAGGGALNVPIEEGTAEERTIRFTVNSPEGSRRITFTGTLEGDTVRFVREVIVLPGGQPGGNALWGTAGPNTFVARRAP